MPGIIRLMEAAPIRIENGYSACRMIARAFGDSDRTKDNRVMQAMMGMRKIVIAELDKAYAG